MIEVPRVVSNILLFKVVCTTMGALSQTEDIAKRMLTMTGDDTRKHVSTIWL